MGPRHVGRGNRGYRPDVIIINPAFNGAATRRSRKPWATRSIWCASQTSMGPRHVGRGNRHGPGQSTPRKWDFNGAATRRSRKPAWPLVLDCQIPAGCFASGSRVAALHQPCPVPGPSQVYHNQQLRARERPPGSGSHLVARRPCDASPGYKDRILSDLAFKQPGQQASLDFQ